MTTTSPPQLAPSAVIVQQGKVLDFIDGQTQREETPEEYVRQEIAKSLVREYHYPKRDIAVESVLRVGSRKPRADLVVFAADADHAQENSYIVVECKAQNVKASDRKEGIGQLHSYLATCPNAVYGMWTNGLERYCYRKVVKDGSITYEEIPDLPSYGQSDEDVERPRFDQLKAASSDALLFAFRSRSRPASTSCSPPARRIIRRSFPRTRPSSSNRQYWPTWSASFRCIRCWNRMWT